MCSHITHSRQGSDVQAPVGVSIYRIHCGQRIDVDQAPGTCDPVFNEAYEVRPTGDESYATVGGVRRNCAPRIGCSHESERVHDHASFATALIAATMFG
jgi:hypothetical protein